MANRDDGGGGLLVGRGGIMRVTTGYTMKCDVSIMLQPVVIISLR